MPEVGDEIKLHPFAVGIMRMIVFEDLGSRHGKLRRIVVVDQIGQFRIQRREVGRVFSPTDVELFFDIRLHLIGEHLRQFLRKFGFSLFGIERTDPHQHAILYADAVIQHMKRLSRKPFGIKRHDGGRIGFRIVQ